jgi:hypothetical protein
VAIIPSNTWLRKGSGEAGGRHVNRAASRIKIGRDDFLDAGEIAFIGLLAAADLKRNPGYFRSEKGDAVFDEMIVGIRIISLILEYRGIEKRHVIEFTKRLSLLRILHEGIFFRLRHGKPTMAMPDSFLKRI